MKPDFLGSAEQDLGQVVDDSLIMGVVAIINGGGIIYDSWEYDWDEPRIREMSINDFPEELRANVEPRNRFRIKICEHGTKLIPLSAKVSDKRYTLWQSNKEIRKYLST